MTNRPALPETDDPDDDLCAEDVAVLMPLICQIQRARADQREALIWLAEHADEDGPR